MATRMKVSTSADHLRPFFLTNHLGVPGPRIRGHQVAKILFGD
jgi:hypothetical protein